MGMIAVEASSLMTLAAGALLLLPLVMLSLRRFGGRRNARRAAEQCVDFAPQAVRVLTSAERHAQQLLSQAMPRALVLAQVPVSRFLRVPKRRAEWVQQVSGVSVDLLLCDSRSRVLVAVAVRAAKVSDKSRRRNELLTRLLKAAGVKMLSWNEAALPDLAIVRQQLSSVLMGGSPNARLGGHGESVLGAFNGPVSTHAPSELNSRSVPLIPVAEILDEGDADHLDGSMEPVHSALFDDFEAAQTPAPRRR